MSIFDIIIITLIAVSAIFGFYKGIVLQLFGLLAVMLGVFCAYKFSGILSSIISKWIDVDAVVLSAVAFIIIMVFVWIAIVLFGKLFDKMLKIAALGLTNRLFGLLFSIVKTICIASVITYAIGFLKLSEDKVINDDFEKSKLYKPMKRIAEAAFPYINFNKFNSKD